MITSRLGFDESLNSGLVKVSVGDTVAFELKDKRGRWRWALGVIKSQPMPRVQEIEVWKKKDRVLSDQEKARAEALRVQIAAQQSDITARKNAAQTRIDTLAEKRRLVVEHRAQIKAQLEKANAVMAKAKDEIEHIDDKDIREMRSYRTAPDLIRLILEAVTIILEGGSSDSTNNNNNTSFSTTNSAPTLNDSPTTKRKKSITWEDVLAKIRQPNFIRDVAEFDASRLLLSTVTAIKRDYLSNPRFNADGAKRASAAVRRLEAWVEAQILASDTSTEVRRMQEEITVMDGEVAELEMKGRDDEAMVAQLERELEGLETEHEDLLEEDDDVDFEAASEGSPSKAKKGEWMPTGEMAFILTTSILSNLDKSSLTEELDAMGGRTFRFDPTAVLATARSHGVYSNSSPFAGAFGSAALPAGFKLSMPLGLLGGGGGGASAADKESAATGAIVELLKRRASNAVAPLSAEDFGGMSVNSQSNDNIAATVDLEKKIKEFEEANKALQAEKDALVAKLEAAEAALASTCTAAGAASGAEGSGSKRNSVSMPLFSADEAEARIRALEEEKERLVEKVLERGKAADASNEEHRAQLVEAQSTIALNAKQLEELRGLVDKYRGERNEAREGLEKAEATVRAQDKALSESRRHTDEGLLNLRDALKRISELTAEAAALRAEKEGLEAKKEASVDESAGAEKRLLEDKIAALEEQAKGLEAEVTELKGALVEAQDTEVDLSQQLTEAEEQLKALRKAAKKSEEAVSALSEEKKRLEQSLAESQSASSSAEQEVVVALRRKLAEAESAVANAQAKATAAESTAAAANMRADKEAAKAAASAEGLASAEKALSEAAARAAALADDIEKRRARIALLEERLAVADGQVAEVLETEEALRLQVLDASNSAKEKEALLAEHGAKIASLEAALKEKAGALEASAEEAKALVAALAEKEAALQCMQCSADDGVKALQAQLETARAALAAKEAALVAAEKTNADLTRQQAEATRAKEVAEEALAVAEKEKKDKAEAVSKLEKALTAAVSAAEEDAKEKKALLAEQQGKVAAFELELKEVREASDKATEDASKAAFEAEEELRTLAATASKITVELEEKESALRHTILRLEKKREEGGNGGREASPPSMIDVLAEEVTVAEALVEVAEAKRVRAAEEAKEAMAKTLAEADAVAAERIGAVQAKAKEAAAGEAARAIAAVQQELAAKHEAATTAAALEAAEKLNAITRELEAAHKLLAEAEAAKAAAEAALEAKSRDEEAMRGGGGPTGAEAEGESVAATCSHLTEALAAALEGQRAAEAQLAEMAKALAAATAAKRSALDFDAAKAADNKKRGASSPNSAAGDKAGRRANNNEGGCAALSNGGLLALAILTAATLITSFFVKRRLIVEN